MKRITNELETISRILRTYANTATESLTPDNSSRLDDAISRLGNTAGLKRFIERGGGSKKRPPHLHLSEYFEVVKTADDDLVGRAVKEGADPERLLAARVEWRRIADASFGIDPASIETVDRECDVFMRAVERLESLIDEEAEIRSIIKAANVAAKTGRRVLKSSMEIGLYQPWTDSSDREVCQVKEVPGLLDVAVEGETLGAYLRRTLGEDSFCNLVTQQAEEYRKAIAS